MMRVVDPIANVERDFVACHTLDPIGDYVPVESLVEGKWYALYIPTFTSRALDEIPLQEQQDILFAIDALSEQTDQPLELDSLAESFVAIDEGIYDKHILKAIFILGAGGAGKGKVSDAMFAGAGLKVINADTHFERFLKAAKVPFKEAGSEYLLFNKARDLRDKELRHYAGRRLGIVIDMTGWAYDRVADPVKKLRELGYDTYAVFVDTKLQTALDRNKKRAEAGGREVPDSFVKDAWHGSQRHAGDYVKLFGLRNFFLVDNDKDLAPKVWDKVVGTKVRKIGRTILNRKLFNPKGKEWIEKQLDPATADANDPKAPNPWPAPEPVKFEPVAHDAPKYKPGSLASKYASLTPGKKMPSGGQSVPLPKQDKKLSKKFVDKKLPNPKPEQKPKIGKQPDGSYNWPKAPKPKKPEE